MQSVTNPLMPPGFIHFEGRRGISADALLASMVGFVPDLGSLKQALTSLGLQDITIHLGSAEVHGVQGRVIHFYYENFLISPLAKCNEKLYQTKVTPKQHELIQCLIADQSISLKDLKRLFLDKRLKPAVSALAIKILEHLETPINKDHMLLAHEAMWIFCHVLGLVVIIDLLDPKFISSSHLQIGQPPQSSCQSALTDPIWIDHILINTPALFTEENVHTDVVALAFMKTVCGHFGPRGMSCILDVSIGHGFLSLSEALWCEASIPASMVECGPMNKAKVASMYEVKGYIKPTYDMPHLASIMAVHGAQFFTWHLVHGEKMQTFFESRFLCSEPDKQEAIEAFLVKAGAQKVSLLVIEQHELNRRLVSLPMGHGQKTFSVRFYEYLYYDKIVRAEAVDEDVEAYIQKTNYSPEVARGDLLMAWKKWRGRVASES